jgi:hypothetical protein
MSQFYPPTVVGEPGSPGSPGLGGGSPVRTCQVLSGLVRSCQVLLSQPQSVYLNQVPAKYPEAMQLNVTTAANYDKNGGAAETLVAAVAEKVTTVSTAASKPR